MKLLIDLGNTRLKWACVADAQLDCGPPLAHGEAGFADAFSALLARLPTDCDPWLASVAGAALSEPIAERLRQRFGRVGRIGPPRSSAALTLAYNDPQTLGVDRWLALLAAGDRDALLVSCGSALTIDLLEAGGRHRGGLIAPAPERMREALLARAPHLAGGGRVVEFADNTRDAVESGAVLAAVALIERQHAAGSALLGRPLPLLLSGGGAAALRPWLRIEVEWREQIVLEGMWTWLRQQGTAAPSA